MSQRPFKKNTWIINYSVGDWFSVNGFSVTEVDYQINKINKTFKKTFPVHKVTRQKLRK